MLHGACLEVTHILIFTYYLQPDPWNATTIQNLVNETQLAGLDNVPWERLQISFEPQVAAQYAANVGSWDAAKRQHTRELLRDLRREFHRTPRLGYGTVPRVFPNPQYWFDNALIGQ